MTLGLFTVQTASSNTAEAHAITTGYALPLRLIEQTVATCTERSAKRIAEPESLLSSPGFDGSCFFLVLIVFLQNLFR